MQSVAYNMDCMDFLAKCVDKQFSLAIVDPPYGIGKDKSGWQLVTRGKKTLSRVYETKNWDKKPDKKYFDELFRVSGNQIIWGGNFFTDKIKDVHSGWIVWDKMNAANYSCSDAELAYTSFDKRLRVFSYCWIGFSEGVVGRSTPKTGKENRIHPTQKPVALYKWLLKHYAKSGDTILDTHLGSGSSRIAAYDMGYDFTGIELDRDYFEAQEKRFAEHTAQGSLFEFSGDRVKEDNRDFGF